MKKILSLLLIAILLVSCATVDDAKEEVDLSSAIGYMEYIEENLEKGFLTGKTDYIVHGRMVSAPRDVYNHLELVSYHVEDDGESVILTGTLGEEWVTRVGKVITTYTHEDGSELTAEDFLSKKDEKITLKTIPAKDANFALFVPKDTIVRVETAWGDILYTNASLTDHGDGDYLICRNVDGSPDLSDVWVVNGAQFQTTYDTSREVK